MNILHLRQTRRLTTWMIEPIFSLLGLDTSISFSNRLLQGTKNLRGMKINKIKKDFFEKFKKTFKYLHCIIVSINGKRRQACHLSKDILSDIRTYSFQKIMILKVYKTFTNQWFKYILPQTIPSPQLIFPSKDWLYQKLLQFSRN